MIGSAQRTTSSSARLRERRVRAFQVVVGEARGGIEPPNSGFADRCLTTWLPRRESEVKYYERYC